MRILLLDLDSTNPSHLGCYGYHRNTSPNIDKIAGTGVRFTNYYTSDAPCFPSRTALMTGQFGIHNGVVGHGGTAADLRYEGIDRQFRDRLYSGSLPGFLRTAGFRTALISPFGERHSAYTFYAGFNEIFNTGHSGMESAEQVTPTVLNWIEQNASSDDWFLYINYWDPHTPYRAPNDYGNPFENEPAASWITDEIFSQHTQKVGPHSMHEINMFNNKTNPNYSRMPGEITDRDSLKRMFDGYDCGIRYMDEHIGHVLAALNEKGILEDTVIIITADHGENMGQLGIYGEHGTADQATCRIPMIIRWPGCQSGHVDEGLHYHLDLGPTLADMLGKKPAPGWDGQSYAEAVTDGKQCGRDYLVISQCAHVCQRSVRFGDWIYMRTYHDGFHLFEDEMLFHLKEDPHEQTNVAADHKEVCREAVYLLNEWHDRMMKSMKFDTDPLWTVMKEGGPFHAKGKLKQYAAHLEQTGRGFTVDELKRRHPREPL